RHFQRDGRALQSFCNLDLFGGPDDVLVGEHVAVWGNDEAAAAADFHGIEVRGLPAVEIFVLDMDAAGEAHEDGGIGRRFRALRLTHTRHRREHHHHEYRVNEPVTPRLQHHPSVRFSLTSGDYTKLGRRV